MTARQINVAAVIEFAGGDTQAAEGTVGYALGSLGEAVIAFLSAYAEHTAALRAWAEIHRESEPDRFEAAELRIQRAELAMDAAFGRFTPVTGGDDGCVS